MILIKIECGGDIGVYSSIETFKKQSLPDLLSAGVGPLMCVFKLKWNDIPLFITTIKRTIMD